MLLRLYHSIIKRLCDICCRDFSFWRSECHTSAPIILFLTTKSTRSVCSKIVELEEELRVVGNNLKSLEVSEEKATLKEEEYSVTLKQVDQRLQEAEARAEFAERSVQKLQKEVDRLEDELVAEKERYKEIGDDLDTAFVELIL
jgi:chromosome segregation ATPase